ncbi:helix-turn-helix domain-containing protein [Oceanirhabdus seepicola]|nr:helix-turn-helix domain-containing protein [Oceanirhabdus seepicola]
MEFKLEVVKYFKENGKAETVKKYNISNTAIYKWEHLYDTYGIEGFKRKTVKKYTVEEKLNIIDFYKKEGKISVQKKYNISSTLVNNWERILLEQGEIGLSKDNRGRKRENAIMKDVNQSEDLLAEVQRLRMENAYLKKLHALVQKREKKQRKKK